MITYRAMQYTDVFFSRHFMANVEISYYINSLSCEKVAMQKNEEK